MKNFKIFLGIFLMFLLVLSSCGKEQIQPSVTNLQDKEYENTINKTDHAFTSDSAPVYCDFDVLQANFDFQNECICQNIVLYGDANNDGNISPVDLIEWLKLLYRLDTNNNLELNGLDNFPLGTDLNKIYFAGTITDPANPSLSCEDIYCIQQYILNHFGDCQ